MTQADQPPCVSLEMDYAPLSPDAAAAQADISVAKLHLDFWPTATEMTNVYCLSH